MLFYFLVCLQLYNKSNYSNQNISLRLILHVCDEAYIQTVDHPLTCSVCSSRESVVTLVLLELLDLRDQLDPVDPLEHLVPMVARYGSWGKTYKQRL